MSLEGLRLKSLKDELSASDVSVTEESTGTEAEKPIETKGRKNYKKKTK